MQWSKLKNIILLILVITNLFLLYFVLRDTLQKHQFEMDARTNAISFLAEKGIQVTQEQVPQTIKLLSQTVERDLEEESVLAAALLGGDVRVEARGSEIYRCQNQTGWIQFHSDGSFSAQFEAGAFPVTTDRKTAGAEWLKRMNFEGEVLNETESTLTVRQLWKGIPLFTQQVTLVFEDNCMVAMTGGRRLMGEPEAEADQSPVTVATALIDVFRGLNELGDVCSEISAIREGYAATASLSGTMTLTPVWHITTDTGTYQLNTLTGVLTRAAGS